MNGRIRELAKQSGGEFWQRIESDGVLNPEAYITFDPPESLEKFAELIVAECVSKIEDEIANARCVEPFERGYISGLSVATEVISQHLGAITTTGELG